MLSKRTIQAGCQVCQDKFEETAAKVIYDARTYTGQWAFLCEECFQEFCSGLGTGRGQKYDLEGNKLEG